MSTDHTPRLPRILRPPVASCSALAAVGGAGLAAARAAPAAPRAAARGPGTNGEVVRLTVLGTTDLHGNVYNWDYFKNAEYDDSKRTTTSASPRPPSIIKAIRAEVGAERTPHARRRRHDPGHAARVLLRQDRPDHRRREAPDGRRDERGRLRRRRARQPRVQLRPRHAAGLREAAATSRCSRPTRSTGTPGAPSSRRRSSRRSSCPTASRSRSASSASSRPASRSGTRPTSRAR